MESHPLISVIVPVYKVEPYLRQCLDSLLSQTYENLEIILVDDGSPDNCGVICDEYATKERRIRVIHQENGGVSAARNAGLEAASGAYLGFVDSDDWIEPDMYEHLLLGLLQAQVDISICGHWQENGSGRALRGWERQEALNTEEAVALLLKDEQMRSYLWDKLYRRELFQGVRFPVGSTFEDVAVQHRLFTRAKKVFCLPETLYHYRQRSDGIVNDPALINRIQRCSAAKRRYDDLKDQYPQYEPLMAAQCVVWAISIWSTYYQNPEEERKKYWTQIRQMSAFAKVHYKTALKEIRLGITGRITVRLVPHTTWWAFAAARLCGLLYGMKYGRVL